jgi:hypothetical protein
MAAALVETGVSACARSRCHLLVTAIYEGHYTIPTPQPRPKRAYYNCMRTSVITAS